MTVDVPLVILAVTFLLSLFALVAFVATVVKAVARRRRRAKSPTPEWSAPFALPAGSFDPSLEGLRVEVPVSAPSAVLFTPIRTGDWLPEPVPGAPGFGESPVGSIVTEPPMVQAVPDVIPQSALITEPIPVVPPQPVPVAQPVPVPQPVPVAAPAIPVPPEPPHLMQPTQPIPSVLEVPETPVSMSPEWVEDDDFDARIAALLPSETAVEPGPIVPEQISEPAQITEPAPEPVSYEFMNVPETVSEPEPQPVRIVSVPDEIPVIAPVIVPAPVTHVAEVVPEPVAVEEPVIPVEPAAAIAPPSMPVPPVPVVTPVAPPTPVPAPAAMPVEAEQPAGPGVDAALEMFGEEWQGLMQPPPARAVVKPPAPRPEVRIAAPAPAPRPEATVAPAPAPRPEATAAPASADRPVRRTRPADIPPLEMAAPVEMWFGDARVGVKAGTATYERFRRFADVMLKDLHEVKTNTPG